MSPPERARLRLVSPGDLTIERRRRGSRFVYLDHAGATIRNRAMLDRIRSLAIPPAYEAVRIAADRNAHLQAIGRDAAGRLQYRYHPDWSKVRETGKSRRLADLCAALPRIRRAVARDLAAEGLPRERVLAAVVALIDRTHIRVGCEDYVHSGRSRGAATLLKRNVTANGAELCLAFRGKGGRSVELATDSDAGLKSALAALLKLPGARLFQYRNGGGVVRKVTAGQVNAYVSDVAGRPVSAKDFRTLAATALAAELLAAIEPADTRHGRHMQLKAAMAEIATRLCNTPAVVAKSYVHARLVEAFENGALRRIHDRSRGQKHRSRSEAVVAALFPVRGGKG